MLETVQDRLASGVSDGDVLAARGKVGAGDDAEGGRAGRPVAERGGRGEVDLKRKVRVGSTSSRVLALTILKASFFLLDAIAMIWASWLNETDVTAVVRFIISRTGLGA